MQFDQPLVSILMNCYNGERHLREAIDSVLAQTYQNWELVFWDNQSTDGSATICKSYGDSRIRYFYSMEHTELGQARIQAFKQLRGDFVAILDADDISLPHRITTQVRFLEQNPEVAIVGSWAQKIDACGLVFAEFKPPSSHEDLHDCLGWTNPIVHSSTMYRRQIALDVGGYSNKLNFAQDFGLTLALAKNFKIAIIEEFLCQLRVLSTSMTRAKKYKAVVAMEGLTLFQYSADLLPLSKKARQLNRRAQALAKIRLGTSNILDGDLLPGLNLILLALISEPSALWRNGAVRRFFGQSF